MVAAVNASSGGTSYTPAAIAITSGIDTTGDVPGLASLASAIGTPAALSAAAGAGVPRRQNVEAGSRPATASLAAIAWQPDGKHRAVRTELLKKGFIRPHGPGRYWYDEAAHRAARKREERGVLAALGLVAAVGALALVALR